LETDNAICYTESLRDEGPVVAGWTMLVVTLVILRIGREMRGGVTL